MMSEDTEVSFMLRLWGKIIKNSRIVRDHVAEMTLPKEETHA